MPWTKQTAQKPQKQPWGAAPLLTTEDSPSRRTCSHNNSVAAWTVAQALTDDSFHTNPSQEDINYSDDKDKEEDNDEDEDDELDDNETDSKALISSSDNEANSDDEEDGSKDEFLIFWCSRQLIVGRWWTLGVISCWLGEVKGCGQES